MAIKYNCPFCDHDNWTENVKEGKIRECSNCGKGSVVPDNQSEMIKVNHSPTFMQFARDVIVNASLLFLSMIATTLVMLVAQFVFIEEIALVISGLFYLFIFTFLQHSFQSKGAYTLAVADNTPKHINKINTPSALKNETAKAKKDGDLHYIVLVILVCVLFYVSWSDDNSTPTIDSSNSTKTTQVSKKEPVFGPPEPDRTVEKKRLKDAIDLTTDIEEQNCSYKINSYKGALENLHLLASDTPYFKSKLISSLTIRFDSERMRLEKLHKKQEKERIKQEKQRAKEEKQLERKRKARLKKLTRKFRKQVDDVENTTFYTHRHFPKHSNSRSAIIPYVGMSGSYKYLRFKMQYTSSGWLFINKVIFSIDGEQIVKNYAHYDWKRDHGSGDIWEWIDISGEGEIAKILKKIIKSKKTIVRFEGQKYRKDLRITSKDKKAMQETIDFCATY